MAKDVSLPSLKVLVQKTEVILNNSQKENSSKGCVVQLNTGFGLVSFVLKRN
jgi:hypothetical protein